MHVDAHQHFWQYHPEQFPWMTEEMAALRRDFLPDDLAPLLCAAGFDGCVAVQARQIPEETDWLLALADRHDFILGVVGWVDLRDPDVARRLAEYARRRRFRGVRHILHDEPDVEFMLRPEFRRGIAALGEFGLTYDLLLRPEHLPAARKLVGEFPRQPFVVDHVAKPRIAEKRFSPWQEELRELAQCENVYCKLSGMVTEADWRSWRPDDFTAYLEIVAEAFGPERLMLGSDWPVCTLAADYGSTMNVVLDFARRYSDVVREGILGGNCIRFYGL